MTADQVREMLRAECEKAGSVAAWADGHALSPQYVGDVLRGRRDPGESIASSLGLERVIMWQKSDKPIDGGKDVR